MSYVAATPQRRRFHVYVDESSQSGQKFMVLGALILSEAEAEGLRARLQKCREQVGLEREIKWAKVSGRMVRAYESYVRVALQALRRDSPGFYAIVVDTTQLDHHRYNGGDREIGFSKFVYQLLLKCSRLFCEDGSGVDCFLDDRTTRQTLDELRKILNAGSAKKNGTRPFKRVEYRDSKDCNLIQAVDLLTGAVAYHWNGWHAAEGASAHRVQLAATIAREVGLPTLATATRAGRDAFSVWKFATSPRGLPKRA